MPPTPPPSHSGPPSGSLDTDPLGATVAVDPGTKVDAGDGARSLEAPPPGDPLEQARLRQAVHGKLFGDGEVPVQIGRFRVLDKLGEGGMGVVFLAEDEELERKVAIKLLPENALGSTGDERKPTRLQREAKAMARLSHPNIAAIYDVGEHEDRVYVAMEYVEGQTLRQWLRGRHDWRDKLEVFRQAAEGLAAAHEAGIVHRDFKPDNAMLGNDGRLRVLDFGLATTVAAAEDPLPAGDPTEAASPGLMTLTQTGALVGTPRYMAPEQFEGKSATGATDQFAYCIALTEALYQHSPFRGTSLPELAACVTAGRLTPPPPSPDLPAGLWPAIARGLATDPSGRYPDMRELLRAIDAAADPEPDTSNRVWRPAALLVGVLGVTGAVVVSLSGRDEPTDAKQEIWGRLPAAAVGETVRDHAEQTSACWSKALSRTPGLHGQLDVEFVIGTAGAVESIESTKASLWNADGEPTGDLGLEKCLHRQIRSWTFPAPTGGRVRITHPFKPPKARLEAALPPVPEPR